MADLGCIQESQVSCPDMDAAFHALPASDEETSFANCDMCNLTLPVAVDVRGLFFVNYSICVIYALFTFFVLLAFLAFVVWHSWFSDAGHLPGSLRVVPGSAPVIVYV